MTSIGAPLWVQGAGGEARQIKEGFEGRTQYSWDGVGMSWGVV